MTELNKPIFIDEITIVVKEFPLIKPYNLSFAILEKFVSIQTVVQFSNQKEFTTEVVPLLGYNDESEEIILNNLEKWSSKIKGLPLNEARLFLEEKIATFPFSTTSLLTAIDLVTFPLDEINHTALLYVNPTSTINTKELKSMLTKSNDTIKVKLTGNVKDDISGLEKVKKELKNYTSKIRFDANQAYSTEDVYNLCKYLTDNELEKVVQYIEQPLPVGEEHKLRKIRDEFKGIHFMLDESIVEEKDLNLALSNNIKFIKLKLFKQGGINEVISIATNATKNGIKVIFGNGVATSISNYIENQIYIKHKNLFEYPLESNGFKKVQPF